ncbi:hypothetical protein AAVH_10386 [Aphelenchoides avenae]|nr:hypothetical protein AAVH_10386 [Aphelenchus avenae]
MARSFGYDTFEGFLQSPEMEPQVLVTRNAEGARLYKVYPTKADLENYVAQQLGTDYGDTKRSLAFHREENARLRSQLAATLERMEVLKTEALKPKSRFRATGDVIGPSNRNTVAVSSERFRKVNANDANVASTSRSTLNDIRVPESDDSAAPLSVRKRMDELERMVQCGICMDRPKDRAFACGHTYCDQCASDLKQCTFGCKKTNGKPLKFKYRIFL